MQLHLIQGRAASGKTGEIMRRIGESLQSGRRVLLLVPEQTTLSSEREMLETLNLAGSMQAHIMSPTRLSRDVFSRVGGSDTVVIDQRGRAMALRRVSGELHDELSILASVSTRNHFAQHASELFSDLKRFGIGAQDLTRAADFVPGAILSGKLRDLGLLMQGYEEWMREHHHMDNEDALYLLAEKLLQDKYWQDADIYIDGFDYLPPGNIAWIRSLTQIARTVTVSVCVADAGDPDQDIFAAGDISRRYLMRMAEELGCPVAAHTVKREGADRKPALNYLERALYAYPAPNYTGSCEGVYLLSPEDPEQEAEQAARLIDAWVRKEGLRYRDIVLLCGDLENSASRIRRVFDRFGIPLFLDERRSVLQHPLVHFAITALETVAGNYRAADLLDCVKTGFCGIDRSLIDAWERQIASTSKRGKRALFGPWSKAAQGVDDAAAIHEAAARVQEALEPLEAANRKKLSASAWAKVLENWMLTFDVPGQLEERCRELEAYGERDAAGETAQVWEEWTDMLGQLSGILGDSRMDARETAQILEAGFVHAEVGVLPVGLDRILCGNIGRTKPDRVKRMLILGAAQGVVPAHYGQDALLTDRDMAILQDMDMTVGRDAGIRLAQSQFGIYHVLAHPTQMLVLSCPCHEEGGAAVRASSVIERIRSLLDPEILMPDPWQASTPEVMLGTAAEAIRAHARGARQDARLSGLLEALTQAGYGPEVENLVRTDPETVQVSSSLLGRSISVSRLEEYAQCPFAWFAGSVLRPEVWEEGQTDAVGAGLLLHEAAAQFGWNVKNTVELSEEAASMEMNRILDQILKEEPWSSRMQDPRESFLLGRIRSACVRTAVLWSEQLRSGKFRPERFEEEFGKTLPGMQMVLDDGTTVEWTGVIDRIDVYRRENEDVIRVVDYKSGSRELKAAGVVEGWQLQLWVYLKTLCETWEKRTGRRAVPGGVFYAPMGDDFSTLGEDDTVSDAMRMQGWSVDEADILRAMDSSVTHAGDQSRYMTLDLGKSGYLSRQVKSPEVFEALLSGAVDTGKRLAQEMRDGKIAPRALRRGQQSACEYCEYKVLCSLQPTQEQKISIGEKDALRILEEKQGENHG